MAEHLEVLPLLAGRHHQRIIGGRFECVDEAGSFDGLLGHAGNLIGGRHADQVQQGGREVDDVVKLGANLPVGQWVDACRPRDDERVTDAARVGVLLIALARGIADLGPAPRIVGAAGPGTDVVETGHGLVQRLGRVVEVAKGVQYAELAALLGCPVVAEGHHHGVVTDAEGIQLVE